MLQASQDYTISPRLLRVNAVETSIVATYKLPNYIDVRTGDLITFLTKLYPNKEKTNIQNWLSRNIKSGFYHQFNERIHLAYADQRDGHNTQHWWRLFFDDSQKKEVIESIKLQVGLVKSLLSEDNDNAIHQWGGLNFRSKTEVRIAHALYQKNVLFFANSRAFIDLSNLPISNADNKMKEKVEVDFLVFYKQKCMILEVDGLHHEETAQKTRDYMRDRVFLREGVPTARFNASDCYNHPPAVIDEFLALF